MKDPLRWPLAYVGVLHQHTTYYQSFTDGNKFMVLLSGHTIKFKQI